VAVGAEGFDAIENGFGGFAGDGLVGDGFEEDFVGGVGACGFDFDAEFGGGGDEGGEAGVAGGEGVHGQAEIEGREAEFFGHCSP